MVRILDSKSMAWAVLTKTEEGVYAIQQMERVRPTGGLLKQKQEEGIFRCEVGVPIMYDKTYGVAIPLDGVQIGMSNEWARLHHIHARKCMEALASSHGARETTCTRICLGPASSHCNL